MIVSALTTAPREQPTLSRTLTSLQRSGFTPTLSDDTTGLGCVLNWKRALEGLLQRSEAGDCLAVFQDDTVCCQGVSEWLEANLWPSERCGVVSLYCASHHSGSSPWFRFPSMDVFWGALGLCFRRECAAELLTLPVVRRWPYTDRLEAMISRGLAEAGWELWMCFPSLCQHIGECSTLPGSLGCHGRRTASSFIGEDSFPDAQICASRSERPHTT